MKAFLVVCFASLLLLVVWIGTGKEEESKIQKLWDVHRSLKSQLDSVEEDIQAERIGVDPAYGPDSDLRDLQYSIREAARQAPVADRFTRGFDRVRQAIADDERRLNECRARIESLKATYLEQKSYDRWEPALKRIRRGMRSGHARISLPARLEKRRFLIWDFRGDNPHGKWHAAMAILPADKRAHSLDDNPLILAIEREEVEVVGRYVRLGETPSSDSSSSSATVRKAWLSLYDERGDRYLGTKVISSASPPEHLSRPAGTPVSGNLDFVADAAIADVVLRYFGKGQ